MSKVLFERAKRYVDKILYIYSVMDKCEQLQEKVCRYYTKFYFDKNSIRWRFNRFQSYIILAGRTDGDSWKKSNTNLWIDNTGKNSMNNSDKAFMKIEEYSEDNDFQLSALYDDNDLYNYYIGSLLYTSGFRGFVRIGISHNTLNAFVRHADDMYKNKDKLWPKQYFKNF